MSEAREAILGSIRAHLAGVPAPPAPDRAQVVGRPRIEDPVATFVAALEALGGTVARVPDVAAAALHLAELARERGWSLLARSDAPLLDGVLGRCEGIEVVDGSRLERTRLFACDAGLSTVQGAVAETGTLVLVASRERHRLVSLVPPVHVAVVHTDQIAPTLDAALAPEHRSSPLVTLVTGPSRTADIELTLVVGVHGPRELHVVLLDEPSAPSSPPKP